MPGTPPTSIPSAHGNIEGEPPSPPAGRLRLICSRLVNVVRRYPFVSAALFHSCLVGIIASSSIWFYVGVNPQPALKKIPHDKSGVGFPSVLSAPVWFKLTKWIEGRTYRRRLSDRFGPPVDVDQMGDRGMWDILTTDISRLG